MLCFPNITVGFSRKFFNSMQTLLLLHRFEKMISGMYLGELARIVCMDLVEKKLLFKGQVTEKFRRKNSFPAEFVSLVERYLS